MTNRAVSKILGRYPLGPFTKDSVRELLQRRFYTGVVVYYGVDDKGRKRKRRDIAGQYAGEHPALVSVEEFDRAQAYRQQVGRRSRQGSAEPHIYPLSGLLICDSCGKRMRAVSDKGRRYYRDLTRLQHAGVCEQPNLSAPAVEGQLYDLLRSIRLVPDWRQRLTVQVVSLEGQEKIAEEEQALQRRLDRATELYLEGGISKERYASEKVRYQADRASLRPATLDAIAVKSQFPLVRLQAYGISSPTIRSSS